MRVPPANWSWSLKKLEFKIKNKTRNWIQRILPWRWQMATKELCWRPNNDDSSRVSKSQLESSRHEEKYQGKCWTAPLSSKSSPWARNGGQKGYAVLEGRVQPGHCDLEKKQNDRITLTSENKIKTHHPTSSKDLLAKSAEWEQQRLVRQEVFT